MLAQRGSRQTDRSRAVNDTIKASHPSTCHVGAFPFSHGEIGQLQITPSHHHEECTMLGQRAINRRALGWNWMLEVQECTHRAVQEEQKLLIHFINSRGML